MKARRLILTAIVLIVFAGAFASAEKVYVPASASGKFGYPYEGGLLVSALTVSGPGTITIDAGGKVDWGPGIVGPNGQQACYPDYQKPLQEAQGIAHGCVKNAGGLFAVFVPQSWVQRDGFQAFDATKNLVLVGIRPGWLFFAGKHKAFKVAGAGTLFLGVNDEAVGDNSGGFNVNVTFTAP